MNTQKSNLTKIPFHGESMWPLLSGNESLLVEIPHQPISLNRSDIGSLFVFKDHSGWVCHRYLGVRNEIHLFKGDFSTGYEFLRSPHVLGRVCGFEVGKRTTLLSTNWLDKLQSFLQIRYIHSQSRGRKAFRYGALVLLYLRKMVLSLK